MSIDTTHVALADEPQLQQMVGNPDPRVSIPAAARLAKLIQERKSQQNQQAMGTPPQPTVKDQLQQAAAPAPQAPQAPPVADTGIAMAAGGMVQRHFWGGGVGFMNDANANDLTDEDFVLQAANADRAQYPGQGQTPPLSGLDESVQAAARTKRQTGSAGTTPPANPKAPTPTPAPPGSGLGHAISTDTLSSGPVNGSKITASSSTTGEADDTPDTPYMDRAKELIDQLNPLQAQALAQLTASKSDEEARYKAAQAAKHDPDKFIDTMNRIVAITHPFAQAHGGGLGNFGSLSEGAYNLAQTQQTQRERQAHEDALHQQALAGIDSGMTQQQIKNLMGAYGITDKALTADQSQSNKESDAALKQSQFELAQAKVAEAQRLDNARIQKLTGGGAGGAGGAGKPMTEQQHQQYARQQAALEFSAAQKRIAAGSDEPAPDLAALAQKHYTLSKQFQPTPVQSAAPASAPGASPGWGQIQRH